jgi:hypothetical protein
VGGDFDRLCGVARCKDPKSLARHKPRITAELRRNRTRRRKIYGHLITKQQFWTWSKLGDEFINQSKAQKVPGVSVQVEGAPALKVLRRDQDTENAASVIHYVSIALYPD